MQIYFCNFSFMVKGNIAGVKLKMVNYAETELLGLIFQMLCLRVINASPPEFTVFKTNRKDFFCGSKLGINNPTNK